MLPAFPRNKSQRFLENRIFQPSLRIVNTNRIENGDSEVGNTKLLRPVQCGFRELGLLSSNLIFGRGLVKFVPAVARLVVPDQLGSC